MLLLSLAVHWTEARLLQARGYTGLTAAFLVDKADAELQCSVQRRSGRVWEVKLRWSVVQETQLVAAGFPCVDVSRAGLRRGMEGKVRCCPLRSTRRGDP